MILFEALIVYNRAEGPLLLFVLAAFKDCICGHPIGHVYVIFSLLFADVCYLLFRIRLGTLLWAARLPWF